MFSRALLVALCIVYATSLSPLTAPAADDDCALYLTGPGRSSAYDYSLNLLKGNFAYDGQHTCITYEAINQAYLDARNRILVSQPKGDWKAEDFASVGELILDISINLARTYGLTYEEIEKGLPLIDTSRTLIREVCPPVFSHVECRAGKYRRLDGLCNNLRHPTWGAAMAPFQRLIGPLFADGINAPRISHTGRDLPLSRVVSRTMHPDEGFHDHAGTVMVIAWGQFMDHDYTLTGTPLDPIHRNDPEECCKRPQHLKHPYCNEIRVPDDDYFYRLFGVKCIDFVRGFPSPRPGCRLGSRVPFNTLTGALDGNTVYGVTEKFSRKLRTGYGGLLRMNPVFKEYGLKDLLPLKLDIPDEGCTRPNKNMYCFEAGEIRVNEQLVLTVMHTLMAREHNRVAEGLAAVNPHWDDETLFQEARRINIAEIQHITYNEFLPILLGKDVMEKFGLVLEKQGYWDGYDPEVNPDVIDSFAAAAYRFGHSLLPTAVERWSKAHKFIASKRLSDLIRRPYDLYRAGVLDEYVMGLMNQVAQAMDDSITQEVTNHLFKKVGARFGMDLVSFNMQRGREFGLPGYMEFRKFCGLSGANSFQDLFGSMSNETIHKYESIFEHPIDVDLWSGGVSERPLPGSMLGPTFACIIATQFSYSRRGDRFWFELPNQPSSFTPEQMVEIRKSRLARVICDNTDIIDTVQLYPMVLPDHELNPRVPCRSGIIPSMDFSKWADPVPFLGGAKEYMTDAYLCNVTQDQKNATNAKQSATNEFEQSNATDSNVTLHQVNIVPDNNTGNAIQETVNEIKCPNGINICEDASVTNEISNKIENADTVLKYVYKKGENASTSDKTKGHTKNRLKRKKRNVVNENTKHSPVSYNSNINHENTDRELEHNLSRRTPGGFIKRDNLANFDIQTVHENLHQPSSSALKDNDKPIKNVENNSFSPRNREIVRDSNENEDDKQDYKENRYRNNLHQPSSVISEKNDKYNKNVVNSNHSPRNRDIVRYSDEIDDDKQDYKENRYRNKLHQPSSLISDENDKYIKNVVNSNHSPKNRDIVRDSDEIDDDKQDYKENKYRNKLHQPSSLISDENDKYIKNVVNSNHSPKNRDIVRDSDEIDDDKQDYKENKYRNYSPRNREIVRDSDENEDEKQNYKENRYQNLDKKERVTPNNDYSKNVGDEIKENQHNRDSEENHRYRNAENKNRFTKHEDSAESTDDEYTRRQGLKENNESGEQYLRKQSHPSHARNENLSVENDYSSEEEKERYTKEDTHTPKEFRPIKPNLSEESVEDDSDEIKQRYSQSKNDHAVSDNFNNSEAIQEVDLGNFSHENIHVNDKGQVEAIKDSHNNYDHEFEEKNNHKNKPSKIINDHQENSHENSNESNENFAENEKHVNINDGEVKPVIELNNEDSDDESEEKNSKETSNANLRVNADENSNTDNSQEVESNDDKKNIKQQFERIPTNYVHTDTKSNENEESDGTLDTISPKNYNFDENLNIKFSDITIKLPEIKLPEDVLTYAKEEPDYDDEKEKKKNRYFHYDDSEEDSEEGEEKPKKSEKNKNGDQGEFYTPYFYGPNEELQKQDQKDNYDGVSSSGEDLYEKFVRERFGKVKSSKKKSEKLQEVEKPTNPKLYEKIQNMLKKANDIQEEAEKSGDPKAGYIWTLEYGENL